MAPKKTLPLGSWNRKINEMQGYDPGNLRGVQGAGNEQLVAARALKHGFIVFFKLWSDTKYDMIIDSNGSLFRAQIKGYQTGARNDSGGGGGVAFPRNLPVAGDPRPRNEQPKRYA